MFDLARPRTLLASTLAAVVVASALVAPGPAGAVAGDHVVLDAAHLDTSSAGATSFDVDAPLSAIGRPGLSLTGADPGAPVPSLTLLVDFDADGNADGTLVARAPYDDWSVSGGEPFVHAGAPASGSLDAWRASFPDAEVLTAGWTFAPGAPADSVVVDQVTIGSTAYSFAPVAIADAVVFSESISRTSSGSSGHSDFQPGVGVRVWTEGATSSDVVSGVASITQPLADALNIDMVDRTTSGASAGLQLIVDFDGDGINDGRLVDDGVGGYVLGLGSKQWIRDAAPDHTRGADHGVLAEWRAAFPKAVIHRVGWWLGPNLKGDTLVERIVVGNRSLSFNGPNRPPTSQESTDVAHTGSPTRLLLRGSDPDGDRVTPEVGVVTHGSVRDGSVFTSDPGFVGTATVQFRLVDPHGARSDWSTDTVTVGNQAPTAGVSSVTAAHNGFVRILLEGSDPDGDELTFRLTSQPEPSAGSTYLEQGRYLVFTPASTTVGQVVLTYVVSDGAASAEGQVVVDVAPDPPDVRVPSTITVRRLNHSKRVHTYEFRVIAPPYASPFGGVLTVSRAHRVLYSWPFYGSASVNLGITGRKRRPITVTYSGNAWILPSTMTFMSKSKGLPAP